MKGARRSFPAGHRDLILALGETQTSTGYARILDDLLTQLDDVFEIEQVALTFNPTGARPLRPIYPIDLSSVDSASADLLQIIEYRRPKVLLINHDISLAARCLPALERVREHVRIVMYCPIDGLRVHPHYVRALLRVHHVVVCTSLQADCIRRALEREAARLHCAPPTLSVIGVGLDTKIFSPHESRRRSNDLLLDRTIVRREIFGTDDLRHAFIVLNANRNTLRKRLDLTVQAFARFASTKPPSVMLWLHTATFGQGRQGWDLTHLLSTSGVTERIIHQPIAGDLPSLSAQDLSRIYNACDVGLNTSMGEGWGLVSFEHAATGAAQLVPTHSGLPGLWGDAALGIECYRGLVTGVPHQEEWLVDLDDLVDKLDVLYHDRGLLRHFSAAALARASQADLNWEYISGKWRGLLDAEVHKLNRPEHDAQSE